jgi:tetratricopeptide (TPR) repeat protein
MAGDRTAFEAAMKRGHNHAWEKQWMKAIEQYELAMAEFPDDATARNSLAFAYFKARRLREALREYRKVGQLRPGDPSPVQKMARILEELGRVADAAQTWMTLAQVHVRQKTLGRAVEAWREAVRLQPANKEAHRRLAEAYAFKSSISEAVQEYLVLARLYHEDGERARAMECCQEALSLDGRSRQVRVFLESLALDREIGVVEPSQPSLVLWGEKLSPVDTAVQRALASLAEAVLGEGQFTDVAEPAIPGKEGREVLPVSQLETVTVLGMAIDCHSRGMVEEALRYYEKAFQMGVERVELILNLALLYKETLRFREAISLLERSVEVSEYRLASHFALGECYRAQGEVDQALDQSLEALKIIDVDIMGQDRANEITQSYQDLANSNELKGDGQAIEVFFNSLTEFFSDSDWKRKVVEVRQKLSSLAGEGIIPTLAEFLGVSGSEQILDVMITSREYLKSDMPYIALEECYRAIEMASTYLPLHLRLAEIFAYQGKVEEAVSKYEAVADAFLMRDNPHKAIEVYGRALLAAPMNISIREKLISLLIDHNEMDRALDEYLALGDGYYRLARVDEALDKYEEALLLVPQTSAPKAWEIRILHCMADLHMQRVQWKKALGVYEKIGKLSPDDEEARLRLVDLRYKLGREDIALMELDSLIVQYGREKEFRKLIETLRELVYSNPQDIPLRSRLSRIYIEAGMKEEAITELDALGELQLEAGLKRDAMDTLRTIISLKPKEEEGYTQLLRELNKDLR